MPFDVAKARIDLAKSALSMRVFAQQELDAAVSTGNQREARSWQSELHKIDKMIARYGLEHYVSHAS